MNPELYGVVVESKYKEDVSGFYRVVKERRVGQFILQHDLLINSVEVFRAIMNEVLVVKCESLYITDTFSYHGYSHHFDSLKEGEQLPLYTFKVKIEKDGFGGYSRIDISATRNDVL